MDRQSDGLVAFAFGRGNRRAYLSASIFHGCGEQTFGPLPNMLMLDGMVRIIPREDGSLLIRDLDMVSVCDDQEMAQLPVTGLRLRYDPERDILIWIRRNAETW